MPSGEEIDRLYQLPLSQFTIERDALLKRVAAGAEKAAVRALQKPTVPAWAVNQLFWQRRKSFDRLMDAAARLRDAHLDQLSGKRTDVSGAEAAHREATKAALDDIRQLLEAGREAASPATMTAIAETLQALAGRDDHGRLVRPLKPLGFEALAGLAPGGATVARIADRLPPPPEPTRRGKEPRGAKPDPDAEKRNAEAAKRAAAARRQQVTALERELREAKTAEREARAAHARVEMSLARARRERKELEARLDEVTAERDRLALEVEHKRKAAERAAADLSAIESRLDALRT